MHWMMKELKWQWWLRYIMPFKFKLIAWEYRKKLLGWSNLLHHIFIKPIFSKFPVPRAED